MIQQASLSDEFKQRLRESLQQEALNSRTVVPKRAAGRLRHRLPIGGHLEAPVQQRLPGL